MSVPAIDLGYPYTLALCDAIETYVRDTEEKDPQVFVYKGANLRYALTRALYSSYANNSWLLGLFAQMRDGSLPDRIPASDEVSRALAARVLSTGTDRFELTSQRQSSKRYLRIAVSGIMRAACAPLFIDRLRTLLNRYAQKSLSPQVLLCVQNERFVRYLEPIARQLSVPYAFLTYDPGAARYLKQTGLPHIIVSTFGARLTQLARNDSAVNRFALTRTYDLLEDSIRRIRPTSIVVVEGNASHDEVVNQICKKHGIASVCLQQGWAPIVHSGFRDMSYSKMLIWGDGFAQILAPHNPAQRFVSTGSHTISLLTGERPIHTPVTISFFAQGPAQFLSEEGWREFFILAANVAKAFPHISVLVREHPRYPVPDDMLPALLAMPQITLCPSSGYTLDEVMTSSDIAISIFSTTLVEAIAAGIVPIMFNVTSFPHFLPDFAAEGAGIEVKNIKEALVRLRELIEEPGTLERFRVPMATFRKAFFTRGKEGAIRAIVKEIEHP